MKQAITVKNIMEKIDEIKAVQDGLRDISVDESENEAALENAMDIHFIKRDMHRAMDDIEGSIEEISFYLEKVKGSKFEKKKR